MLTTILVAADTALKLGMIVLCVVVIWVDQWYRHFWRGGKQ